MPVKDGLDDARNFIARVIALPDDGDGFIGIHNTFLPRGGKLKNNKLPFGRGVIAGDAEDAAKKVGKLLGGNNRDIYVCMGTQKTFVTVQNRSTHTEEYKPDKHRDNICRLKSLYLDVDFKGGAHGYASQTEAELAVSAFLGNSGLPEPSVVVHTGGGFHIYWVFTRPLDTADWQILADHLVAATKVHGLKCDSGVTSDASRILRVPGTLNYKYNPPRQVVLHTWGADDYDPDVLWISLGKFTVSNVTSGVALNDPDLAAFVGVKPVIGFRSKEEITELGDGRVPNLVDIHLATQECGFLNEALTTGGKDFDNPLWNLTTLLSVFTTQGRDAAHDMSKGHPNYDPDQTDKEFDRKTLEVERGLGWPRCATIAATGSKPCAACPHLSKGQYPFTFAREPAPAPVIVLQTPQPGVPWTLGSAPDILPNGYQRDKKGLIYRLVTDDDGNNIKLLPSESTVLSDAYVSSHHVMTLHFTARIANDTAPRQIEIPNRFLHATGSGMTDTLSDHGVSFHKKEMGAFLVAWVEKLKESKQTHSEYPPFGWAIDQRKKLVGFSYGGMLYTPTGEFKAGGGDQELAKQYYPSGNIDDWKRAAKLVTNTKRAAMDAILASAFAAPLVYFTGEQGLYFGVYSQDSGVGKTTAMRTAQSVWSNPSVSSQRLQDTTNSVQQKMGELRHLPIYWDELKGNENLRQMAAMIFDLTSGKSKARLNASIGQREVMAWHTMLVTASNNSMVDYLNELAKNNDAGFYRLFELEALNTSMGKLSTADAGELRMLLEYNYGVAGLEYAKFLGRNFEQVHRIVKEQQLKFEQLLNTSSAERNWLNAAVVLCVGASLANSLDLTDIDVTALRGTLANEIVAMRGVIVETPLVLSSPELVGDVFIAFLRDHSRKLIITTDIWDQVGRPVAGAVQLIYPQTSIPLGGVVGQFSQKARTLRISKRALDDWLKLKDMPLKSFTDALKVKFKMTTDKKSIGVGVPATQLGFTGGQQTIYDIDCGLANEMSTFIMDAIQSAPNVVQFAKP